MAEEYLTTEEVAALLKLKPKSIRNRISNGTFRQGVHYFRPTGMRLRFKWSSIVLWLESENGKAEKDGAIPMSRGYTLGDSK